MTLTTLEEWRPVSGFEGYYEVSNLGGVRSVDRSVMDKRGRSRRLKGRPMAPQPQDSGHLGLKLSRDGVIHSALVHRMVVEAFRGPIPAGAEVCHWNDQPADNRLENLRAASRSENKRDAVRNGIHPEARKTRCPSGHLYVESNIYRAPGMERSSRYCRACRAGGRRDGTAD